MNKTLQEGIALAKELNEMLANEKPNCDVIICTPFIHLASVTPLVDPAKIGVGAENCADKESGAYTGEVSAAMVAIRHPGPLRASCLLPRDGGNPGREGETGLG